MNIDMLRKWAYGYDTTTYNHSLSDSNSSSSTADNNFGSHAPGIIKSMQMLEAQFGHPHASSPSPSPVNNNINDVINNNMMMLNTYATYDHPDLPAGSTTHSQEPTSQTSNVVATDGDDAGAANKNDMMKNNENVDDGRIHSLPHNKHGPYTCSKCNIVVSTSQKFASHVALIHYKFESGEERKKRYMSRIRKRSDLHIQNLDDGTTTFVPVVASVDHPHAASVNHDHQNMIAPTPPLSGVKVKLEPADN